MKRVSIPVVVLAWVVVGVIIAINEGYGDFDVAGRDDIDMVGRFILAVILWPVLALGGDVDLNF
jgi:hypothetical protein